MEIYSNLPGIVFYIFMDSLLVLVDMQQCLRENRLQKPRCCCLSVIWDMHTHKDYHSTEGTPHNWHCFGKLTNILSFHLSLIFLSCVISCISSLLSFTVTIKYTQKQSKGYGYSNIIKTFCILYSGMRIGYLNFAVKLLMHVSHECASI